MLLWLNGEMVRLKAERQKYNPYVTFTAGEEPKVYDENQWMITSLVNLSIL